MIEIDLFLQMASDGRTAREISERFGVSRQRVHQLAKKKGVAIRDARMVHYVDRATLPGRRAITGGVPVNLNSSATGKVGEMLAAADLTARGWDVFIPLCPTAKFDLIASRKTTIVSVEVRTAHRKNGGSLSFGRKTRFEANHYALVVTGESVIYDPELPQP